MAEIILQKDLEAQKLQMGMPKAMNRTNPTPLDATSVWNSLDDLKAYAQTNPVAYIGQVLSLVAYDEENKNVTEVKAYIIKDAAGNVEEVGSATLGDDKTITLENGTLSLNNWGKEYYKWVDPVGEEGEDGYVAGHHEKYEMQEGDAWPAGLEPKAATATDGTVVLAWYQPSTTTIEGVSSAIASVQNTVTELTTGIGSREDAAGAETVYGAINKVEEDNAANAEAIEALQEEAAKHLPLAGGTMTGDIVLPDGGKAISDLAVDTKISTAIGSAGHLKREIVDELPIVADADAETIYMVLDGLNETENIYDEYMIIGGGWEKIGDTAVDISNLVEKVENAVEDNLAALDANGALVDAGVAAQDVADHLADEEIHITAQERTDWNAAKATADQAASDIAALVKISQDDADKLAALPGIKSIGANLELGEDGTLSAVAEQYELPAATATTLGGVKVGTGLAIDAEGTASVALDATNANGLAIGANGLQLAIATADNAGAMSASMASKLAAIAEGAQVNKVEGALLDGIVATINDGKQIVIPTATNALAGLVYSSDADDGVAVDAEGLMSVNNLSTSKLYIPEGEELVLNGGSASI